MSNCAWQRLKECDFDEIDEDSNSWLLSEALVLLLDVQFPKVIVMKDGYHVSVNSKENHQLIYDRKLRMVCSKRLRKRPSLKAMSSVLAPLLNTVAMTPGKSLIAQDYVTTCRISQEKLFLSLVAESLKFLLKSTEKLAMAKSTKERLELLECGRAVCCFWQSGLTLSPSVSDMSTEMMNREVAALKHFIKSFTRVVVSLLGEANLRQFNNGLCADISEVMDLNLAAGGDGLLLEESAAVPSMEMIEKEFRQSELSRARASLTDSVRHELSIWRDRLKSRRLLWFNVTRDPIVRSAIRTIKEWNTDVNQKIRDATQLLCLREAIFRAIDFFASSKLSDKNLTQLGFSSPVMPAMFGTLLKQIMQAYFSDVGGPQVCVLSYTPLSINRASTDFLRRRISPSTVLANQVTSEIVSFIGKKKLCS